MQNQALAQASELIGAVHVPLSTDLGLLAAVLLLLLIITLWKGSGLVVSMALALYPAYVLAPKLVGYVPQGLPALFGTTQFAEYALLFLAIVIVATLGIYRFMEEVERPTGPWRYIEAVLVSLTVGGALFATAYAVLKTQTLFEHSGYIEAWFVSDGALLLWLCAPLMSLLILVRR